jgi:hypothetical protein
VRGRAGERAGACVCLYLACVCVAKAARALSWLLRGVSASLAAAGPAAGAPERLPLRVEIKFAAARERLVRDETRWSRCE